MALNEVAFVPLEIRGVAGPRSRFRAAIRSFLVRRFPAGWVWLGKVRGIPNREIARFTRRWCDTYVGVTGSCGKSTATYLIGSLLDAEGQVVTVLHQNSQGGVFMALAGLRKRVDFFVQEMAGGRPGLMSALTPVVRLTIGVVTTVGHDHFTSFRDQLGDLPDSIPVMDRYLALIAAEKGKLVEALPANGVACLNADQTLVREMGARCKGRVVLYGTSKDAEVRAENVSSAWPERLSFDLVVGDWRHHVQTRFIGTISLSSVLSSLAAVHAVGGDLERAANRLAELEPLAQRTGVRTGRDGHTYVVDTTKAPLWQLELLLEDIPNLRAQSLVFVLGEVSDTRTDKSRNYRRLLRRASEVADYVVGFGPCANSASKVRAEGCDNVVGLETYDQVVAHLAALPPSLVFLKSSKSTRMHRIWEAVAPD